MKSKKNTLVYGQAFCLAHEVDSPSASRVKYLERVEDTGEIWFYWRDPYLMQQGGDGYRIQRWQALPTREENKRRMSALVGL